MADIPEDVMQKARETVDAVYKDIRDRRFLKWLFSEEPTYIGRMDLSSLDADVLAEIHAAWSFFIARAILAERSAAKRRIEELEADATAEDIEAAARDMYGSKWDSPKDDERPGEKMKAVWRKYAADAVAGFLAHRALLRDKESK